MAQAPSTSRKPKSRPHFEGMAPLSPRSMLFTLFGDYAYPTGEDVSLGGLIRLAQPLGVSEAAVRSAVARLARRGWLAARRCGTRSHYGLTGAGRTLIAEGTQRIYGPHSGTWSGKWCLLTYSIPESRRSLRDRMRKRLAWLGFGALGGGAYISPRPVEQRVDGLLEAHGVGRYAKIFTAALAGPGSDEELARRCWDLAAIAERYERFVSHYAPLQRRDVIRLGFAKLSDDKAFAARFALTHDFRRFPYIDPDLPPVLLPKDWAGGRARRLFEDYHDALAPGALRHFRRCCAAAQKPNVRAAPSPDSRRRRDPLCAPAAPPSRI
ncbi:MAG: phenylacetic acid degradation operon negative regulatory protein PaaX [Candidatus Eremiobacteraeota bacterium]|nr:phenylacetic acid degradation operon negative regulatory protein PaaX [Candidatus Eremiobacteraeota bacterium]